jgi:hypothetical protein
LNMVVNAIAEAIRIFFMIIDLSGYCSPKKSSSISAFEMAL